MSVMKRLKPYAIELDERYNIIIDSITV